MIIAEDNRNSFHLFAFFCIFYVGVLLLFNEHIDIDNVWYNEIWIKYFSW